MGRTPRSLDITDTHKALVARVMASRYLIRSARLQELLLYLTDRVLDHEVDEIHEQEVGAQVFGRTANYDSASDNIVRVHASMLRKRLEQYFSHEGADEPVILELPKGNYAPVFSRRPEPEPEPVRPMILEQTLRVEHPRRWSLVPILAVLLAVFACSTAWLLWKRPAIRDTPRPIRPTVDLFWSQVFRPDRPADIVLDDASVGLYQDLTGRSLTLSEYFDRDYLRRLPSAAAAASIDEHVASSVVLRRNTSYSGVSFIWKLADAAPPDYRRATLHFAREYSFRDLKANSALLVGNSRTNPWIEPFEQKLGLRWDDDSKSGVFVPRDTWNSGATIAPTPVPPSSTEPREGYFGIALVPNLGGNGSIMIVSGSGGSAINAGMDFLSSESSVAELHHRLLGSASEFPKFEALIKVTGRSKLAKDAVIVICRELPKH
ncbi:MAG TPA: hypothetical protein VNU44_05655 [Bryobacteraceae bacterium]|nr:hypothetical protein [Bryobacteraceae bacterium]